MRLCCLFGMVLLSASNASAVIYLQAERFVEASSSPGPGLIRRSFAGTGFYGDQVRAEFLPALSGFARQESNLQNDYVSSSMVAGGGGRSGGASGRAQISARFRVDQSVELFLTGNGSFSSSLLSEPTGTSLSLRITGVDSGVVAFDFSDHFPNTYPFGGMFPFARGGLLAPGEYDLIATVSGSGGGIGTSSSSSSRSASFTLYVPSPSLGASVALGAAGLSSRRNRRPGPSF